MWVILEIPSRGRPRIVDTDLYDTWAEAREAADNWRDNAKGEGRSDRYSVHEVEMGGVDR